MGIGWEKVDVGGRVMWESSNGEKVSDPHDIDLLENQHRDLDPWGNATCSPIVAILFLLALAFILGLIIGLCI